MVAAYCPDAGDIVWIDFDPQSGREIMKRRPGLVLSKRWFNERGGLCVVVPITSKVKGRQFEVPLTVLTKPSVILSCNVHNFDWRTRNAKFIAKAPDEVLEEVRETIAALLGID